MYLRQLEIFSTLLLDRQTQLKNQRRRYQAGLRSLEDTALRVQNMQEELTETKPLLEATNEKTKRMLQEIEKETVIVEKVQKEVSQEEETAREARDKAQRIEADCARDLKRAMPMLRAAVNALDTLTAGEIAELKAMYSPPLAIRLVMECLCVMKDIKPVKTRNFNTGNFDVDYWEPSKRFILSDSNLLKSLIEYDKDNIPARIIKKIRQYMALPEFSLTTIANVSRAAHSLCSWIVAIESYDRVIKEVRPKQEALVEARAEFDVVKAKLDLQSERLSSVEEKVAGLQGKLASTMLEKQRLEDSIATASKKLDRAHRIINGLSGEKERWTRLNVSLAATMQEAVGDTLLCSGMTAYLGAMPAEFRARALDKWQNHLVDLSIVFVSPFVPEDVMGDPVTIRSWHLQGLPNGKFSTDSALILAASPKWPLMIDPQSQAVNWVKRMEKDNGLVCINSASGDYLDDLLDAVRTGRPCLLEELGEHVDNLLGPLLRKQVLVRAEGLKVLSVGGREVEYREGFKFYMATKLANPYYLPETADSVTLLNFSITRGCMEDQLLNAVVARERPSLEAERNKLVLERAQNLRQLRDIEDSILGILNGGAATILDDEKPCMALDESKR